jgi:hypothetical protein
MRLQFFGPAPDCRRSRVQCSASATAVEIERADEESRAIHRERLRVQAGAGATERTGKFALVGVRR